MISFTSTIHIARPAPLVYDYLVDLEHLPEWNWAITETVKATPGPIVVGTRFVQTRTTPRLETERLQIAALSPHDHIEIDGVLAGFDARVVYDLTEERAGTALANTILLDSSQLPHVMSRLIGPRIRRSVASNLRDLRSRLTGATSPSEALSWPTSHSWRLDSPIERSASPEQHERMEYRWDGKVCHSEVACATSPR